ncbi:hypothetical protein PAL_GLEAN10021610 [Pteropus alecto]|uniref:Uncharacterized protein n=1 Tax=Pteropus alecto TaxID=9402 RepID=L5KAS2_PTEAL|nr:hypothetical protein PAL_GLEAN10021610 [Pteropus alecto]
MQRTSWGGGNPAAPKVGARLGEGGSRNRWGRGAAGPGYTEKGRVGVTCGIIQLGRYSLPPLDPCTGFMPPF